MLDFLIFGKGLLLGFAVAAPVGPIGLLCIRRSLALGSRHGLATGLGAATADAAYGIVAGFGLSVFSSALLGHQNSMRLIGGIFLAYLGFKSFFSRPPLDQKSSSRESVARSYLSSLFLTVTNPMTIFSFAAAFAGLGLGADGTTNLAAALMVLGVFLGSASWWLALSTATASFKRVISPVNMLWINRISGAMLIGFAFTALASFWGEV